MLLTAWLAWIFQTASSSSSSIEGKGSVCLLTWEEEEEAHLYNALWSPGDGWEIEERMQGREREREKGIV